MEPGGKTEANKNAVVRTDQLCTSNHSNSRAEECSCLQMVLLRNSSHIESSNKQGQTTEGHHNLTMKVGNNSTVNVTLPPSQTGEAITSPGNTLGHPPTADASRQQGAQNRLRESGCEQTTLKRQRSWKRYGAGDGEEVQGKNPDDDESHHHGDTNQTEGKEPAKKILRKRSRLKLKSIPNMLYNGVKIALEDMTEQELKKCIRLLMQDTKGFGLSKETLSHVNTVEDLISAMEAENLLSEDNLYLMQYMLYEIGNQKLCDKLEEYSHRRDSQPICLFKTNKKALGCSFVEFKIEGHVKHLKNTKINEFRSTVCKNLGIKMHNVNLVGIQDGSIILIFQIPEFAVEKLRLSISCQDVWLGDSGVVEVRIDNKERYIYAKCVDDIPCDEVQDKATSTSQDITKEPTTVLHTSAPSGVDSSNQEIENILLDQLSQEVFGHEASLKNVPPGDSAMLRSEPSDYLTDVVTLRPPVFTPPPSSLAASRSLPSNSNFPGDNYKFQIYFEEPTPTTTLLKNVSWTYSNILKKLFVDRDKPCPIQFKSTKVPPVNSHIRAMPVFKKPEHIQQVVKRCPNHADFIKNDPKAFHLIMSSDPSSQYVEDPNTGRLSVLVPYSVPQVGTEYSQYLYTFKCFLSCVGGLNRRQIQVAFTLENNGQVLGRQVIDVRVCSCPGRERRREEKQFLELLSKKKKDNKEHQGDGDIPCSEIQDEETRSKLQDITREPTNKPYANETPCDKIKNLAAIDIKNQLTQEMFDFLWTHLQDSEKNALEKPGCSSLIDESHETSSVVGSSSLLGEAAAVAESSVQKSDGISVKVDRDSNTYGVSVKPIVLLAAKREDVFSDADSALGSELNSDVPSDSSQEMTTWDLLTPPSPSGDISETTETHEEKILTSSKILDTETDVMKCRDSADQDDCHQYTILVKGQKKYDILMKIKESLDLMDISTESQLILIIHDIAKEINGGKKVDIAILDFTKAFDKVSHCIPAKQDLQTFAGYIWFQ